MLLVETTEDVDRLEILDPSKLAYLTQTTLSVDEAEVILSRLRQRFPQAVGAPKEDICYATQNRQEAIKALLPMADVALVVGSRNSSNSTRLNEVARTAGRRAYLVDDASEIDPAWFTGDETVALSAGASAPEDLVTACVDRLRTLFGATVEQRAIREEYVEFPLPLEVRERRHSASRRAGGPNSDNFPSCPWSGDEIRDVGPASRHERPPPPRDRP